LKEDELRKFGLRLRPRVVEKALEDKPGHIAFDDRGNAIYEWNDDRLAQDGADGEKARRRALAHPGLAVVEDETNPSAPIRNNKKGLRLGYNPYESGLLDRTAKARLPRRNLRELSRWIETKKKVTNGHGDEE
jgi:hypothetical protein